MQLTACWPMPSRFPSSFIAAFLIPTLMASSVSSSRLRVIPRGPCSRRRQRSASLRSHLTAV
jgi:hypothetical protein